MLKRAKVHAGRRAGTPTDMAAKPKALERETRAFRQVNEILWEASAYFALAKFDNRSKT